MKEARVCKTGYLGRQKHRGLQRSFLFFPCVSFWIVFIAMSSDSLIFPSAVFNLLFLYCPYQTLLLSFVKAWFQSFFFLMYPMPPLKLLNIQTTVTKCTSVFPSYNICAGSRMVLIDCFFSLLWILSCSFVCLVIFHWILHTVNFPYWTRYFVVSQIFLSFVLGHL